MNKILEYNCENTKGIVAKSATQVACSELCISNRCIDHETIHVKSCK